MSAADEPRFAVSTPTDQQAWLWVACLLSMIYSVFVVVVRLFLKWSHRGADDIALGVAFVVSLIQWALLLQALNIGLGKAASLLTDGEIAQIGRLVFTTQTAFLISLSLTTCSVFLLVRQIFSRTKSDAWTLCNIGAIVMVVWAVVAPLVVSVGCAPDQAVNSGSDAHASFSIVRWRVVAAFYSFLEALCVALPVYLFSAIKLRSDKRWRLGAIFAARLLNIGFIWWYVETYASFLSHGSTSIGMVKTLGVQQILLFSALASATGPTMMKFVHKFTTADLVGVSSDLAYSRSRRDDSHQSSYVLKFMSKPARHGGPSRADEGDQIRLRPGSNSANLTEVYHQPTENESVASTGSAAMGIHRKISFEVLEGR